MPKSIATAIPPARAATGQFARTTARCAGLADRPGQDRLIGLETVQVLGQRLGGLVAFSGSFSRHFRRMVSMSCGSFGTGRDRRDRVDGLDLLDGLREVAPRNGGRPVKSS